ncbi:MAG: ACP S-malonyltransferase [Thermacetogeniaceae bacterium]
MRRAFVFPGQGSQYVGMGAELARLHRSAAEIFEQARQVTGYPLLEWCTEGPAELLNRTRYTQPALITVSVAILMVLREQGVTCQAVAGHSLGEYTALVAAGVLPFVTALEIVNKRAEMMDQVAASGRGGMAAVIGLERSTVAEICLRVRARGVGVVQPANFNAPNQIVISGEKAALEEAIAEARRSGARKVATLAVSGPFHTSLMAGVSEELKQFLQKYAFAVPKIPLAMNASGEIVTDPGVIKDLLAAQVSSPVLWEESVRGLAAAGFSSFLEVGPGQVLAGLIKRTLAGCRIEHVEDQATLEKMLAQIGGTV